MSVKEKLKNGGRKFNRLIVKFAVGWFVLSLVGFGVSYYYIQKQEAEIRRLLYRIERQKQRQDTKELRKELKRKIKEYEKYKKRYRNKLDELNDLIDELREGRAKAPSESQDNGSS